MTVLYYPLNDNILESDTLENRMNKCGANTGNIVWARAIKNNILYDKLWENEEYTDDNIIIPMANDLNPYNQLLEIYKNKFIRHSTDRITILGLGAQLSEEWNTPKKLVNALPSERKKALHILSEHTRSIGIRGWITAECLDLLGIHNYRVIGCPSFYIFRDTPPQIPKAVSADKLCISWGGEWKKEQYIKELLRKNKKQGDALIMQSMEDLPRTLFNNEPIYERHIAKRYPDLQVDSTELFQYIKDVAHMFFDEKAWNEFLVEGEFTMSVGCRFHGNMKSWQMGIPTLWITHDSRTRELCEVMKLPNISVDQSAQIVAREELIQYCYYDKEFYENYHRCYLKYKNFLKENNIELR